MDEETEYAEEVRNAAFMMVTWNHAEKPKLTVKEAMQNVRMPEEICGRQKYQMRVRRQSKEFLELKKANSDSFPKPDIVSLLRGDSPSALTPATGILKGSLKSSSKTSSSNSKRPPATEVTVNDASSKKAKRVVNGVVDLSNEQQAAQDNSLQKTKELSLKKTRRTPHQVQVAAARKSHLQQKDVEAHKECTRQWAKVIDLPKKEKNYKTAKVICDQVNAKYGTSVTDTTVRKAVAKGIVGQTPPRRGNQSYSMPKRTFKALCAAYLTHLKLMQAGRKGQPNQKVMIQKIEQCFRGGNLDCNYCHLQRRVRNELAQDLNAGTERIQEL